MQQDTKRFRVYEGVGVPPLTTKPHKWGDLPLATVAVGDLIEIPTSDEERVKILSSVRSYVWRESKKLNKKYSVRKTEYGIGIWRVGKTLPPNHSYQLWKRRIKR